MSGYLNVPKREDISEADSPSLLGTVRDYVADEASNAWNGLVGADPVQMEAAKKYMGDKIRQIAKMRLLYEASTLPDRNTALRYIEKAIGHMSDDDKRDIFRYISDNYNPAIASNDMVIIDDGYGPVYAPRKNMDEKKWYGESTGDLINHMIVGGSGFGPREVEALIQGDLDREGDYPSRGQSYMGDAASMVAPRVVDIYKDDEKQSKRGGYKNAMGKAILGDAVEDAALMFAPGSGLLKLGGKVAAPVAKKAAPAVGKVASKVPSKAKDFVSKSAEYLSDKLPAGAMYRGTRGLAEGAANGIAGVAAADIVNDVPGLESRTDYTPMDYALAAGAGMAGRGFGRAAGVKNKQEKVFGYISPSDRKAMGLRYPSQIGREEMKVVDMKLPANEYNSAPVRKFSDEDVQFGVYLPELPKNNKTKFKRDFNNPNEDQWVQYKDQLRNVSGIEIPASQDEVYEAMFAKGMNPESYMAKNIMNPEFHGKSGDIRSELSTISSKKGTSNDSPYTRTNEAMASFGRRHLTPTNESIKKPYHEASKKSADRYDAKAGENYEKAGNKIRSEKTDWSLLPTAGRLGRYSIYRGIPTLGKGATRVYYNDLPDVVDELHSN